MRAYDYTKESLDRCIRYYDSKPKFKSVVRDLGKGKAATVTKDSKEKYKYDSPEIVDLTGTPNYGILSLTVYSKHDKLCKIYYDPDANIFETETYVENKLLLPNNALSGPEGLLEYLESRCMPIERENIAWYLDWLGLTSYNPVEIVKRTYGIMWEDFEWVQFDDVEEVSYDDIKVRG